MNFDDVTAYGVIKGQQYATKTPILLNHSTYKPYLSNPVTFYLYYKDL